MGGARPLVGREQELAALEVALAAGIDGHAALHVLAGEAGIGKSRLAEELCERASARGVASIWGRAWDSGGAPAFWPWSQVVRALAERPGGESLIAGLPAGGGAAISRLTPELSGEEGGDGLREAEYSERIRFTLFDSLATLLRRAAGEAPLLVVLDDIHAADQDSLLALRFVANAVRDAPVLVLATERDPALDLGPEIAPILRELAQIGDRSSLSGLGEEDLGRLIRDRGTDERPGLAEEIHAITDGNPFHSAEIARMVASGHGTGRVAAGGTVPLPASLRETLTGRLDTLSDPARGVLRAGAVVGREFKLITVQQAVLGEGQELLEALDEAASAGIVAPQGAGRFRFTHGLLREAAYAELGAGERVRAHRAVAEALEERYGDAPERAAELAHHFASAAAGGELADRAVSYALRAGVHAGAMLAYEQAGAMFELALEVSEAAEIDEPALRAEILMRLGVARTRMGHERARETLLAGAAAAREAGLPDLLAECALAFRAFQLSPGVVDDAIVALQEEALAALPEDGLAPLRARLLARLLLGLYYRPGSERRRSEMGEEAIAIARAEGDSELLAYVLVNVQAGNWVLDNNDRALEWVAELLELTELSPDLELALTARNRWVDLLLGVGDLPGADIGIEALDRMAERYRHPRGRAWVQLQRGRRAVIDGDFEAAEAFIGEAIDIAQQLHDAFIYMIAMSQRFGLAWAAGRLPESAGLVKRFADGAPGMPVWRAALARVYCAQGRETEARRELERLAEDDYAMLPRDNVWLLAAALLAEVCAELGDAERAASLRALLEPFAGRMVVSPHAIFAGPVTRYLALLADTMGDSDAAGRRREQASASLPSSADAGPDSAGRPSPGGGPAATGTLRLEGDVWAVELGGQTVRVKDGKGMRYLAVLLESPGAEVHALTLATPGRATEGNSEGLQQDSGHAGPRLDEAAKAAYRERVRELRAELEEAEAFNDPERVERARVEMDAVAGELAGAVGLGGRDRVTASNAERARVNVTRAIRSTVKRISEHDAAIGRELDATVSTGTFCSYRPDPRQPVNWSVEAG